MIKVFYNETEINNASCLKEACKVMGDYLLELDIFSPYTRCWVSPVDSTRLVIDYGSHSNFFYFVKEEGWEDEQKRLFIE